MFSTLYDAYLAFQMHFKMLSAIRFNLDHSRISSFGKELTLSQMTNFRLFQIETVCRRQFQNGWKWQKVCKTIRKHCGKKEKSLVTSNFSFAYTVFIRFVWQTCKNQGLFGKGLWVKRVNARDSCLCRSTNITLFFSIGKDSHII